MKKFLTLYLLLTYFTIQAQDLEVVPLGVYGGSDESNLSSYLIGNKNSNKYIALDAGTIYSGIKKAINIGTFTTNNSTVLKEYIKGYFISHGHLDHLSGLIINSPEDAKKPIYGTNEMINVLINNYFTNAAWANFGNEGDLPILNKYTYKRYNDGDKFKIEETDLIATIFDLSHVNPLKSSALLLSNKTQSIIYFGDTGADRIENTNNLDKIWQKISPLIISGNLKTIMIEVSFPNSQPENLLFGHLTPRLLQEEMNNLSKYTGKEKLQNLNIIVTHLKPKEDNIIVIKKELEDNNSLNLNYIYPKQGEKIIIK